MWSEWHSPFGLDNTQSSEVKENNLNVDQSYPIDFWKERENIQKLSEGVLNFHNVILDKLSSLKDKISNSESITYISYINEFSRDILSYINDILKLVKDKKFNNFQENDMYNSLSLDLENLVKILKWGKVNVDWTYIDTWILDLFETNRVLLARWEKTYNTFTSKALKYLGIFKNEFNNLYLKHTLVLDKILYPQIAVSYKEKVFKN